MPDKPMPPTTITAASDEPVVSTAWWARLANIVACPGDVFDEVAASPHTAVNWLAPTFLVCLTGVISVFLSSPEPARDSTQPAMLTVVISAWLGPFWAAFVLSIIGRVFLKTRFPYLKAVEVAGLAGMILALGTAMTTLLALATGNAAARPALSMFVHDFDPANRVHAALAALNLFHLWATGILAVGLSKLSGASFKESAFWVFGYWLGVRVILGCV
jgi:hypothetical protein